MLKSVFVGQLSLGQCLGVNYAQVKITDLLSILKKAYVIYFFSILLYFILLYYSGQRMIKDDFRFQFLISTKLSNSIDTHKHENKEKLSINSLPLFTCQLVSLL